MVLNSQNSNSANDQERRNWERAAAQRDEEAAQRAAEREEREKKQAEEQARRDAEQEVREKERHEAHMAEVKARAAEAEARTEAERARNNSREKFESAQLALLGALAQILPVMGEAAQVFVTKSEFCSPDFIRAAACGLIKKAAGDRPADMKEAAEKLLQIVEGIPGKGK